MKEITIKAYSHLSENEINTILEGLFYDGSHFDDIEDVNWTIK